MNATTDCAPAAEIYSHLGTLIVHLLVIICNCSGAIITVGVTYVFLRYKVFHINLRILFTSVAIQLLSRASCTTYRSATFVYYFFTFTNACDLLESKNGCSNKVALFASFQDTLVFSFTALGLERVWATRRYETYESQTGWILQVVLILISWFRVIMVVIKIVFAGTPEKDVLILYCSSLSVDTYDTNFLSYVVLPLSLFCGALFVYVYKQSTKKNQDLLDQSHTLSSRFQLMENIQTSRLVAPCGLFYVFFVLCNLGFFLVLISHRDKVPVNWPAMTFWKEVESLGAFPIYINIYPLLFLILSPSIRKQFKPRQVAQDQQVFTIDRHENATQHMHTLEQFWAKRTRR